MSSNANCCRRFDVMSSESNGQLAFLEAGELLSCSWAGGSARRPDCSRQRDSLIDSPSSNASTARLDSAHLWLDLSVFFHG